MSSSVADSYGQFRGDSLSVDSTPPFDDGYLGTPNSESPRPIYVSGASFSSDPVDFSPEISVKGPDLPPASEMEREEGFALREWRRKNAIRLEEKEKREKELLGQVIVEADAYKFEYQKKGQITCETHRAINREKEKVLVAIQDKFHAEADKDYWKSIAELIPKEVPAIEKRKGKKEQVNKPSIVVVQGPKSGKLTDLARMRHILVKLKHNTPPHLKLSPPAAAHAKTDSPAATMATPIKVVASAYGV